MTAELRDLFSQGRLIYAVMYLESDSADTGRIRGPVEPAHVHSVVGGLVFEYTDEWWRGVQDDTYHTGCYQDNASFQSVCGADRPDFGLDDRSNAEWYGLYNTTYPGDGYYDIRLHPRPAVAALQTLWNANETLATVVRTGPGGRRHEGARGYRRLLQTTGDDPETYSNIFPSDVADHLRDVFVWLVPVVPAVVMLLLVGLPYLWMPWQTPERAKGLFDNYSPRSRGSIPFLGSLLDLEEEDVTVMSGGQLEHYDELKEYAFRKRLRVRARCCRAVVAIRVQVLAVAKPLQKQLGRNGLSKTDPQRGQAPLAGCLHPQSSAGLPPEFSIGCFVAVFLIKSVIGTHPASYTACYPPQPVDLRPTQPSSGRPGGWVGG